MGTGGREMIPRGSPPATLRVGNPQVHPWQRLCPRCPAWSLPATKRHPDETNGSRCGALPTTLRAHAHVYLLLIVPVICIFSSTQPSSPLCANRYLFLPRSFNRLLWWMSFCRADPEAAGRSCTRPCTLRPGHGRGMGWKWPRGALPPVTATGSLLFYLGSTALAGGERTGKLRQDEVHQL